MGVTATDELRRLLDERGVEWTYGDGTVSYASDGRWFHAWAYNDGAMCVSMGYLTPEQAIEATLGLGTCRITDNGPWGYPYVCSACGASFDADVNNGEFNYCPNCGRRVEQ